VFIFPFPLLIATGDWWDWLVFSYAWEATTARWPQSALSIPNGFNRGHAPNSVLRGFSLRLFFSNMPLIVRLGRSGNWRDLQGIAGRARISSLSLLTSEGSRMPSVLRERRHDWCVFLRRTGINKGIRQSPLFLIRSLDFFFFMFQNRHITPPPPARRDVDRLEPAFLFALPSHRLAFECLPLIPVHTNKALPPFARVSPLYST